MPFDFTAQDLSAAGVFSLGITAVVALVWQLMQNGVFGLMVLTDGDRGMRSIGGWPLFFAKRRFARFRIKYLYEVLLVNTYPHVHDPVTWECEIGGEKMRLSLWIVSRAHEDKPNVRKAIYSLGDSAHSHDQANRRTLRIEKDVRTQLTKQSHFVPSWRDISIENLYKILNPTLLNDIGSDIMSVELSDTVPSEAEVIARRLRYRT